VSGIHIINRFSSSEFMIVNVLPSIVKLEVAMRSVTPTYSLNLFECDILSTSGRSL
jgi:hypothetical protein